MLLGEISASTPPLTVEIFQILCPFEGVLGVGSEDEDRRTELLKLTAGDNNNKPILCS